MKKILITGSAGFIGFHLTKRLIAEDFEVVGLDAINDYYQIGLKYDRLNESGIITQKIAYNRLVISEKYPTYRFIKLKLEDEKNIMKLFANEKFDIVIHLAAQAGVRNSIDNPLHYINSNIVGFHSVLEGCRHFKPEHLVFASSSSVYGLNRKVPFTVNDSTNHPISLYGATKKSNEMMAHTYSHLFRIPITGLRFFTVYGPWGRPDMAYFLFTEAILNGEPIKIFNQGDLSRDFTYIDDIVEGLFRVMNIPAVPLAFGDSSNPLASYSSAPFKLYNIGNQQPITLLSFIETIEKSIGKTAKKEFLPMQAGDVKTTYAEIDNLINDFKFKPKTNLKDGIDEFLRWYMAYNKITPDI